MLHKTRYIVDALALSPGARREPLHLLIQSLKCLGCGWTGHRSQCAEEELSEKIVDLCPKCGADCE